ncbi:MAG: glycosyltransferase family 1 protein [Candidatus Omnitrophota bacterium]
MRIGVDGREIENGVYTGIGRSLHDFLKFAGASLEDEVVVFSRKPLPMQFGLRVKNHVMVGGWGWWWDQVQLPLALAWTKVGTYYSPYYKIPLLAGCRKVCSVLDLINLEFEGYAGQMTPLKRFLLKFLMSLYMESADAVITCSQHAREDIVRVFGLSRKRIAVVPLTVSDCFSPAVDAECMRAVRHEFGIHGAYILYVGNFKAHKNVSVLIDAFGVLAHEFVPLKLVLAGPRTHGFRALQARCQRQGLQDRVIFTDKIVDERACQALYAGAEVCVMPSLYEGFGLPSVEAMACGTPVICARATSLPEVAGDAAILVDPASVSEMAMSLKCFLLHDDICADFVKAGLQHVLQYRSGIVMPKMMAAVKGTGE